MPASVTGTTPPADFRSRRLTATIAATPDLLSPSLEAQLRARNLSVTTLPPFRDNGRFPVRQGPSVAILATKALPDDEEDASALIGALRAAKFEIIMVGPVPVGMEDWIAERAGALLPSPPEEMSLITAIQSALRTAALRSEFDEVRSELVSKESETQSLYDISRALGAEKDLTKLEDLVLGQCRRLTNCDAGTLYLLDLDAERNRILRFEIAHNDTLGPTYAHLVMPLTEKSISGYVGIHGTFLNLPDVYQLPSEAPYSFSPDFDKRMGYRSKSMLVIPLRNYEKEIVGVVQLINKKVGRRKLRTPEITEQLVVPFNEHDEQVLDSFAGQAAMALDNRLLIDSIEKLFEGFVRASVTAIEARDPTTSGHSNRVAELTVGIGESINRISAGKFKTMRFSDAQLREIRYAGLLHDFGKIGVREHVLVKAKKLYDWQLEIAKLRFAYARKTLESEHNRRQLTYALEHGNDAFLKALSEFDAEFERQAGVIDEDMATILRVNEPTVLEEEAASRIYDIGARTYVDIEGREQPLLDSNEVVALAIRRGSLTEEERQEINSHVAHTFRFLSIMPWTRLLKDVPEIAGAHHEKLDGTGYPNGLNAATIPFQSKMMAVSDVFDALTASDRPYKRAVPIPKALDILLDMAGPHLDPDIVDLFIQTKVYEIGKKEESGSTP
ncbi:MAG: GAF domain-containing protein [Chloroflexi bacterium]|nr:GAF domain-containing protein [Chloroflexota bacterium]